LAEAVRPSNPRKSPSLDHSATLCLSNDTEHILLLAEVQVFGGYVFAELSSFAPSGGAFQSR
jgi:hypothetical protein